MMRGGILFKLAIGNSYNRARLTGKTDQVEPAALAVIDCILAKQCPGDHYVRLVRKERGAGVLARRRILFKDRISYQSSNVGMSRVRVDV